MGVSIAAEDVSNIVALEHVNTTVADQGVAMLFYIVGMGFTRDPHFVVGPDSMWVNLGMNQFHLPSKPSAQVMRGHVDIVMKDLEALEGRLRSIEQRLAGTQFAWARHGGHVHVTSPWGNQFNVTTPSDATGAMTLGISSLEFLVKRGTAAGIARFYEKVMGAPVTLDQESDLAAATVGVGLQQSLVFRETTKAIREYDGHHVAVYCHNVSEPYDFFQRHGIVMEEMVRHQFRFKHIVDPDNGQRLYELEHEVRSMRHPMYMRPLVNRDPSMTMAGYSR